MELLTLIAHILNFAAPALALALCLPLAGRFTTPKKPAIPIWYAQVAMVFAGCLAVLVFGLVFFGRDGKMATYMAMVMVGASVQWLIN